MSRKTSKILRAISVSSFPNIFKTKALGCGRKPANADETHTRHVLSFTKVVLRFNTRFIRLSIVYLRKRQHSNLCKIFATRRLRTETLLIGVLR